MMMSGFYLDEPSLFRHGFLCETGFEIADLLAMALPLYPYRKYDGFKADMKAPLLFHHVSVLPENASFCEV